MPEWLQKQLIVAYLTKNQRKIRLLNDCWFFYHNEIVEADPVKANSERPERSVKDSTAKPNPAKPDASSS